LSGGRRHYRGDHPARPKGPAPPSGPKGPRQNRPPGSRWQQRRTRCCVGEHAATFSPPHTRSCSAPAAAKPVFVRSVLANLPECAADTRPAATRADRDNCFAAAPTAAWVCCSTGTSAGPNGPRWVAPVFRPVGPQAAVAYDLPLHGDADNMMQTLRPAALLGEWELC
jgi:hypothetical protein